MRFHDITKADMLNGDGIRVVLFVSGCTHKCPNCHNPLTHDINSGKLFTDDTLNELLDALSEDYISGITLSGGDPMHPANRDDILELTRILKRELPDKTIWMYTGFCYEQLMDTPYLEFIDVLVDGRYVESLSKPSPKWRGSTNQRVIDVQKSKKLGEIVLHCE